jgi:hypothetical protein
MPILADYLLIIPRDVTNERLTCTSQEVGVVAESDRRMLRYGMKWVELTACETYINFATHNRLHVEIELL